MKSYRIALAQINPVLGNLNKNATKILKIVNRLKDKADLIIFPELSLVGYPPEDLVLRKKFLQEIQVYLNKIHNFLKNKKISIVIGAPIKIKSDMCNAAIYINRSKKTVIFKNNLPNYGVFDEKRIFHPGPIYNCINYKKLKIGLMICEDMWTAKIAKRLNKQKANIFICINASPYDEKKQLQRKNTAKKIVKITKKPLLYINQIGGQDFVDLSEI